MMLTAFSLPNGSISFVDIPASSTCIKMAETRMPIGSAGCGWCLRVSLIKLLPRYWMLNLVSWESHATTVYDAKQKSNQIGRLGMPCVRQLDSAYKKNAVNTPI